jgi:LytS/YehU family sensor histidine kinase
MQARVEPSFLFDTLGEIAERYDRDPGAGEQMLNELIDYLRAALPDVGVPGSTLRQEAALARAFLAILAIRADGRLAVQVQIADGLDELGMPPAILVPLLAAAVPISSPIATPSSVQLAAIVDGALVRIVITGRGASMRAVSETQIVHDIRERLRSFYGEAATLDVHVEPARRLTLVLRLPRAHA